MPVTYNGSSITTGTMYDDGTIKVKDGFGVNISGSRISNGEILLTRKKSKIPRFEVPIEENSTTYSSGAVISTKMKKKILTFTSPDTDKYGISNGSIETIRIKKAIITP